MRKLLAAGFFCAAPLAWCHAVLLQASPQAGSSVSGPAIPVSLRFNSRVDARRSKIAMIVDGKERLLAISPQSAPDTVATEIKSAKPGRCRLRWQVLASDGHITRGEIVFQVK